MCCVLYSCVSVYYLVCSNSHHDIIPDLRNRCLISLFRSSVPALIFQHSHIHPSHLLPLWRRGLSLMYVANSGRDGAISKAGESNYQIPGPNPEQYGPDCERTPDYGSNKPGYVRCWRASPLFYPAASVCGSSGINHITGLGFSTEAHRGLIITRSLHQELPV